MKINETAYVFNGDPFGLQNVYCSELRCFLDNLDYTSVTKYIESIKNKWNPPEFYKQIQELILPTYDWTDNNFVWAITRDSCK